MRARRAYTLRTDQSFNRSKTGQDTVCSLHRYAAEQLSSEQAKQPTAHCMLSRQAEEQLEMVHVLHVYHEDETAAVSCSLAFGLLLNVFGVYAVAVRKVCRAAV